MPWIHFDRHEDPAPTARLTTLAGEPFAIEAWRGAAQVVVAFVHDWECAACQELIQALAAAQPAFRERDAECVVVLGQPPAEPFTPPPANFHLALDATARLRQQYAALIEFDTPRDVMLFVLSRYSAPRAAWVGPEFAEVPTLVQDCQDWLDTMLYKCAA